MHRIAAPILRGRRTSPGSRSRSPWLAILTAAALWLAALPVDAAGLGWRVSTDDGNELYLVGTVHAARPGFYPLPAELEQALADSSVLVLELDMRKVGAAEAAAFAQRHGLYPPDESLEQQLSPEDWRRVRDWALRVNLPLHRLERMRPWLATVTLVALEMHALGLDPALGMERHFAKSADAREMPIIGLETMDQQFSALANLSPATQRAFLEQSLATPEEFAAAVEEIIGSWAAGDAAAMAAILDESYEGADEVYEALMRARNLRWLPQIERMLDSDQTHFVAVGALHLVGEDGLTTLLERNGYRVERL